ncbi:hypothetical protein PTTG_26486 [Puccinia triticina 1-1 BBBD Race 1]|uniref:Uncharacterized protein n=1 Tax=Puccinia triticina (isolate 1-1 / race 1 (BBBD)) TaxID=630390 RepID=A0A180GT53_PUCT1|nr:hypothetical protein PTTG_26486 [Puccinia triticina 1-1 BBBD Race 1]
MPKPFIPLLGNLSTFAINLGIEQYKRLADLDPTEPCSNTVNIGVGVPCPHRISDILENGDFLAPEDFHPQWSLKYNPEITQTDQTKIDLDDEIKKITLALSHEDPKNLAKIIDQINQIGRPSLKKARSTSTKRNPSTFELVEASLKKKQLESKKRALKAPERKSKRMKSTCNSYKLSSDEGDSAQEGSESDNEERKEDSEGSTEESEEGSEADSKEGIEEESNKTEPEETENDQSQLANQSGRDGGPYASQIPPQLRQEDILKEVEASKTLYSKLQGGKTPIEKIIAGLKVESLDSKIDRGQWLDKLSHGQMLANAYVRPIIFLSLNSSTSISPSDLALAREIQSRSTCCTLTATIESWLMSRGRMG